METDSIQEPIESNPEEKNENTEKPQHEYQIDLKTIEELSKLDDATLKQMFKDKKISKKLLKEVHRADKWKKKREKEREKRKKRKQEKAEKPTSTEKEENNEEEEPKAKKQYKNPKKWKGTAIEDIEFFFPNVVIDLSFTQNIAIQEQRSVCNQILHSYGSLKAATRPLHLHVTSFQEPVSVMAAKNAGFPSWKIFVHPEHFLEVFDHSRIVYLTPDSPNELEQVDENSVYIIGGIADNADSMKGTTYNWAVSKGIQTAKFPIDKYITVKRRNVLNVNHVFEILMKVAADGDWKKALEEYMPDRLKRPL